MSKTLVGGFAGIRMTRRGGIVTRSLLLVLFMVLAAVPVTAFAAANAAASLLGTWVQDDAGPVLTYRRVYRFNRDGTYEFLFTVRNTGSTAQRVLVRERGRYGLRGDLLVITPQPGQARWQPGVARSFPWRVERDPYVGDLKLVLVLPGGILDVFYRP